MQGCLRNLLLVATQILFFAGGCSDGIAPDREPEVAEKTLPPITLATNFQPEHVGVIQGKVTWEGTLPNVPNIRVFNNPVFLPKWPTKDYTKKFPNPNAPIISKNRGIKDAVVFLRQMNPAKAKKWNHPPVDVYFQDYQIHIKQGNKAVPVGFIQRGQKVSFSSEEERFHAIRAEGAAFFTMTLPKGGSQRFRKLNQNGFVELSSAAGYFWLRGHLLVADHPYLALTDADGRFEIPQVPPGEYELAVWMPNWHHKTHHRDPETRRIIRYYFRDGVEVSQMIRVYPQQTSRSDFSFRLPLFE